MEEELTCPACQQLYNNPVLLPCYHTLCLNCAVHLQQPAQQPNSENVSDTTDISEKSEVYQEVDKLSILSETDSGVVCNSRPNSYVGTPNIQGILFPPVQNISALCLTCPVCHKLVYFDENGVHNLPKYRTMQNTIDRYVEGKHLRVKCQLCENDPKEATIMCEQCEVFYCDICRENCHPARGPLAKHNLVPAQQGKATQQAKFKTKEAHCAEHAEEILTMYCMMCKVPACMICLQEGRHTSHDVQAIVGMCKAQKTELSQNLQQLSEKAKSATEFIQRLKLMTDKVNDNCIAFENIISEQMDALVAAVNLRKQELLDSIKVEKEYKSRVLKDQVSSCTHKLQQTTGLIQFSIEALKETDAASYLQVGSMLITRVANVDITWPQEMATTPQVSHEFDLTLDDKTLMRSIEQLNFIQMKPAKDGEERRPAAPGPPTIIPEECSAENNSVTIAWQQHPTSYIEGYVLEMDDGNGGEFREVYCGKETICTVDGLHFNSMYNARVKAFNSTGEGDYSDSICLQTAEVAWFTFDPSLSASEVKLSNENMTVTCDNYEHKLAVAGLGFSRGVHYWEFVIDKYDSNADPAFGVTRLDASKEGMLGKDDKGWSMYIDHQRSWFMHANVHENRVGNGISSGSTVGVLLDLERHIICFYVNEEPQGPIAFHDMYGVFYPAVSLNRNVSVTLHTALDPPSEQESEGDES